MRSPACGEGPPVPEPTSDFAARLAKLKRQYVSELPTRLAAIATEIDAALADPAAANPGALRRHVHGLSGSGATFGFQTLSERCRAMESTLVRAATTDEPLDLVALLEGWAGVQQAAEAAMDESVPAPPPAGALAGPPVPARVWLIDPAGHLDADAPLQLAQHGFIVESFGSPAEALDALDTADRAVLVVDAGHLGDGLDGIGLAERLAGADGAGAPVVFLGASVDLATRLRAVRAGGIGWLRPPVASDPLMDLLERVVERGARAPYRVLIVEDDPAQAEMGVADLRRAGFETQVVSSERVLDSLESTVPDVVLMDLYLETCLGSELALIIRQDARFIGLPIVFLSLESDEARKHSALVRGGDVFLTKPLAPERLAELLGARASRARAFRQQLLRDGLTGTLNHAALMGALASEVAGAIRRGTPLAFAMFDLDSFKAVNDRHGHAVGDRVLHAFAQLLKQRLRAGDTIGRYGGEEFGLILPDTTAQGALALTDTLREAFAEIEHTSEAGTFRVTVSAGVATCPQYTSAPAIRDAADAALYRAKRAGRNRVELDA